jgi:formylglycine-generating enzyme required for sulfatase activity
MGRVVPPKGLLRYAPRLMRVRRALLIVGLSVSSCAPRVDVEPIDTEGLPRPKPELHEASDAVAPTAPSPSTSTEAQTPGRCPSEMAFLEGGTFTMGRRGDEVTVSSFCLDITEVTVNAYTRCVEAGRCSAGKRRTDTGDAPCGIQDLAGNVIEWTATEFNAGNQVIRGGCWAGKGGVFMPAAARNHASPTKRDTVLGFRCARALAL